LVPWLRILAENPEMLLQIKYKLVKRDWDGKPLCVLREAAEMKSVEIDLSVTSPQ
jgi:hypothetical protein